MSSIKIKKNVWYLPFYTVGFSVRPQYTGIPHLVLVFGSRKRVLSETALSKGTLSIRINVHRSNLYTQLIFQ